MEIVVKVIIEVVVKATLWILIAVKVICWVEVGEWLNVTWMWKVDGVCHIIACKYMQN